MRFATLSQALLILLASGAAFAAPPPQGAPAQSAPPQSAPSDNSQKLQAAVQDSQRLLGELEPWQKRLFAEEVMPQYQRFIRDYRASGAGLVIDVDVESIKNYLRFYGPKSGKTKVLMGLKVDPNCPKCVDSTTQVRALLQGRVERRGLTPVWLTDADLKADPKQLEPRVIEMATEQKLGAALLITMQNAPVEDDAHADEIRMQVRALLWVKDVSKHDGLLEILENDSLEKTAARLLTDFLTDLGTKLDRAQTTTTQEKFLIEVTGIQGFSQYLEVKNRILGLSKDGIQLEERKVSRGKVVFAVFGDKPMEVIKRAVAALDLDKVKVQVQPAGETR